ncbi:MAG: hypothetical protein WCJ64_00595 [Rhodospirillaceae bacterium]
MSTMLEVRTFERRTGHGRAVMVGVLAYDPSTGQSHERLIDTNLDPCRGHRIRAARADARHIAATWKWLAEARRPFPEWQAIVNASTQMRREVARYFDILHFDPGRLEYTIRPKSPYLHLLPLIPWLERHFHVAASYQDTLILTPHLTAIPEL